MLFWAVILGVYMGWVESIRDKPRDIPETDIDSDAYTEMSDISGDIPEFLLRPGLIPSEPSPLAVAEAERIVGSRR